ncbi:MAG: ISPsy5, transposase [uncultured Paraburkholderia sp.]|nr:MAG: ISPsy5, transposase [uncultured Paraburkholderia sp.]
MIATVATAKYVDGMPLYRMQAALARWQITVSRGTLVQWVIPVPANFITIACTTRCTRRCCRNR